MQTYCKYCKRDYKAAYYSKKHVFTPKHKKNVKEQRQLEAEDPRQALISAIIPRVSEARQEAIKVKSKQWRKRVKKKIVKFLDAMFKEDPSFSEKTAEQYYESFNRRYPVPKSFGAKDYVMRKIGEYAVILLEGDEPEIIFNAEEWVQEDITTAGLDAMIADAEIDALFEDEEKMIVLEKELPVDPHLEYVMGIRQPKLITHGKAEAKREKQFQNIDAFYKSLARKNSKVQLDAFVRRKEELDRDILDLKKAADPRGKTTAEEIKKYGEAAVQVEKMKAERKELETRITNLRKSMKKGIKIKRKNLKKMKEKNAKELANYKKIERMKETLKYIENDIAEAERAVEASVEDENDDMITINKKWLKKLTDDWAKLNKRIVDKAFIVKKEKIKKPKPKGNMADLLALAESVPLEKRVNVHKRLIDPTILHPMVRVDVHEKPVVTEEVHRHVMSHLQLPQGYINNSQTREILRQRQYPGTLTPKRQTRILKRPTLRMMKKTKDPRYWKDPVCRMCEKVMAEKQRFKPSQYITKSAMYVRQNWCKKCVYKIPANKAAYKRYKMAMGAYMKELEEKVLEDFTDEGVIKGFKSAQIRGKKWSELNSKQRQKYINKFQMKRITTSLPRRVEMEVRKGLGNRLKLVLDMEQFKKEEEIARAEEQKEMEEIQALVEEQGIDIGVDERVRRIEEQVALEPLVVVQREPVPKKLTAFEEQMKAYNEYMEIVQDVPDYGESKEEEIHNAELERERNIQFIENIVAKNNRLTKAKEQGDARLMQITKEKHLKYGTY